MIELIKEPSIVAVISGTNIAKGTMRNRPAHTFIYKVDGESIYYFKDKEIRFTAGTVLYIPEEETYSVLRTLEGKYILVNFHAEITTDLIPRLFSVSSGENIFSIFKQMERIWRLGGNPCRKYETLSQFYHLLAVLSRNQQMYSASKQKEQIKPAIDFLENHIFDVNLKITALHEICNISAPTFRRIFSSIFGSSPKKYIIHQRLLQARAILEGDEYESIADVAHSVGYDDPLYFSKHFKNFYGIPPSEF